MHDHQPLLEGRIRRHLDDQIKPAARRTVAALTVFASPVADEGGVPGQGEPISFAQAMQQEFVPFDIPGFWGPGWGTTWFKFTCDVPAELRNQQLELMLNLAGERADDGPGFQAEGLVYRPDGSIIKAINPKNRWIPVEMDDDGRVEVYVEAASNPTAWGSDTKGEKFTVGPRPTYLLGQADLCIVHHDVVELVADLTTLFDLAMQLPEDSQRRWALLVGMSSALDKLDLGDIPGTAGTVRDALAPLWTPAEPSAHRISAVGHAHIDTAWLWPIRETRRKVARTVANVLNLIGDHPEFIFAFPAAQHLAWLETDYPDLFERLKDAIRDGKIIPVGGMWVEPDAVLPGGEAICRQLVYGHQFFAEKFGVRCRGMWLPDSFGYSGALPQLARLAGMEWFLTQKISWNQVNKFPHHTFWWEGIDGTRIFTHFPPTDTYNSDLSAHDLAHAAKGFRDKGRANRSMTPFGYGDGGGGPTREMLMQAARVADLEGSPRVEIEHPDDFFTKAREEYPDAATWVGELYLELHRATFTSQANTKLGNRRNEALLHDAEWFCALAAAQGAMEYPYDELAGIWRQVLTGQFHDILPGSSIAWVHRENAAMHVELGQQLDAIIRRALDALGDNDDEPTQVSANPMQHVRHDQAALVSVVGDEPDVTLAADGEGWVLTNPSLSVRIDAQGLITSMKDRVLGWEMIPAGARGNLLQLHQDYPNAWDAWDVDEFYRHSVTNLDEVAAIDATCDGREAVVTVRREFGKSVATQTLRLRSDATALESCVHVDWHEQEKFLKLAWPCDIHTTRAAFETQFGHVWRGIHTNTSWDAARFEVNAHRWIYASEGEHGLAVANRRTYGWDVGRAGDDARHLLVRASLLRGPKWPDPHTDQGEHDFLFLVGPASNVLDAVSLGYRAVCDTYELAGELPRVWSSGGPLIETVKMAEDRTGDLIVRVYEPRGVRCSGTIGVDLPCVAVEETDLLEQRLSDELAPALCFGGCDDHHHDHEFHAHADDAVLGRASVRLHPFQVVTLRFKRA